MVIKNNASASQIVFCSKWHARVPDVHCKELLSTLEECLVNGLVERTPCILLASNNFFIILIKISNKLQSWCEFLCLLSCTLQPLFLALKVLSSEGALKLNPMPYLSWKCTCKKHNRSLPLNNRQMMSTIREFSVHKSEAGARSLPVFV